jgi:hypothetical protein
MSTKTLLIIFAILLLLLTLLSSFGGSIRPIEKFDNHPFEKFYDSSGIIKPEAGSSLSNNPIFQEQSSTMMGKESVNPPPPFAPTLLPQQEGESFIEPFEEEPVGFSPY